MTVLTPFLRKALLADAVVSGIATIGMIAGAGLVAAPFGLPAELTFWAGIACAGFVALLIMVVRAGAAPAALLAAIVAINFAWVAGSLFVAFGPMFAPTLLGKVFVCAQAAAVLLFAELQVMGLRRMSRMSRIAA